MFWLLSLEITRKVGDLLKEESKSGTLKFGRTRCNSMYGNQLQAFDKVVSFQTISISNEERLKDQRPKEPEHGCSSANYTLAITVMESHP